MLKIRTYTGVDQHGGTGLFAAEDIAAGTLVWDFHPDQTRFISIKEYFASRPVVKEALKIHSYPIYAPDEGTVGVMYNLDNAKFMNHSEHPNTGSVSDNNTQDVALRFIPKDTEITCNYYSFDPGNVVHQMGVHTCKTFLIRAHETDGFVGLRPDDLRAFSQHRFKTLQ